MISLACPGWRESLMKGASLIPPGVTIEKIESERAVAIFNRLRLPDVIGQPTNQQAAGEWFRDIVRTVFGTAGDGIEPREVREFFVLVPKKNNKTTGGAGIMLTALLMNKRPRAEFLFIGPTQDVSKLAFNQAVGMVEADPDGFLQKRMHIREHLKEIIDRRTRAVLKIKTFDSSVLTGVKPVGILIDELHEISRSGDAGRVIGQIRGGMIANPEAFMVIITTQSDTPPAGAFKDELMKARAIRDGLQPGAMLPILYEFPEDIASAGKPGETPKWYDHGLWNCVTPNNGRSVFIPRLFEEFKTAESTGPHELARWASQHLNIEIGLGLRTDRWTGSEYWERRGDKSLTLDEVIRRSECIVVGIDGGGLDDLFGLAVLGRCRETGDWLLWSHAWCNIGVLDRRKQIAGRLRDFERDGDLTIQHDRLEDLSKIAELIQRIKQLGLLGGVAVDPAGLGELVTVLTAIEVTEDNKLLFGIGQGYRLMNAIKTAERRLFDGTLRHGASEMMAWAVTNLRIEPTATAIRATKQIAGDAKIDPAMGMFNAVDLMTTNPEATGGPSIYDAMDPALARELGIEPDDDEARPDADRTQMTDEYAMADDDEEDF